MRRTLAGLLLAVILIWAPTGTAINPLDDDAGSGGDAPDTGPDGIEIAPGRIEGRLTPPADPADRYLLEGERGDVIEVDLDADGPVVADPPVQMIVYDPDGRVHGALMADGSAEFLLPRTGTWALSVELSTAQTTADPANASGGPTPYTLEIRRREAADHLIDRTAEPRQTLAVRTDGPTDLHLRAQINLTAETGRPSDAIVTLEYRPADQPEQPQVMGITFAIIYRSDASGDRVRVVTPAGGESSPRAPNAVVVDGELVVSSTSDGFDGTIRLTAIHGGSRPGSLMTAYASDPVEFAADAGDGLVRWDETNADSDLQVLTPAASVTGERTLAIDVTDRFDGFFRVGRLGGWAEDPDGRRRWLDVGATLPLVDLEPGRWTFHLNATAGTGPAADPQTNGRLVSGTMRTYLLGAPTADALLPSDAEAEEASPRPASSSGSTASTAGLEIPAAAGLALVGLVGLVALGRWR